MKHIVSFSGGLGSAEALKQTVDKYGKENVIALFADVKGSGLTHTWSMPTIDNLLHERFGGETRDLYRFIWQLSEYLDVPVIRLEDGRTVFKVFADNKAFRLFSGGVFVHKCSEQLKRLQIKKWILASGLKTGEYDMTLGFGWDEEHRLKSAQAYWRRELGWDIDVKAPLHADSCDTTKWLADAGIEISKSYIDLFEHDNCGGGCIAAGQAHFANLYNKRRDVYLYWAYMEQSIQRVIGKPVTILKDERGATKLNTKSNSQLALFEPDLDTTITKSKPLSLYEFIPRIEAGDYVKNDWGGCGCFVGQPSLLDLLPPKPIEITPVAVPVTIGDQTLLMGAGDHIAMLTGGYVLESMKRSEAQGYIDNRQLEGISE